jgi:epoxyqueuosine reductase QueG
MAAGNIREIRDQFPLSKEQDLSGTDYAISMVFPIPIHSLDGIVNAPTLLYKHAYGQVNYLMDRVALGVALRLQESGHKAIPIPASQIIDWEVWKGHASHRQIAVHLGQGWHGRNNLLVTPERGSQVRLVSVLTDMEVEDPGPWGHRPEECGCGKCRKCIAACPAGAIKERPLDYDLTPCAERIRQFEKIRGIGQRICGICVRVCNGPAGIRDE